MYTNEQLALMAAATANNGSPWADTNATLLDRADQFLVWLNKNTPKPPAGQVRNLTR